ncbi:MAG: ABC transporter substrate-binding protein [Pseudomonadota bacterium]
MKRRSFLATGCVALALPGLALAAEAQRIVVAGGDLTEIVFALGEGARVVGVDSTATWPPEAAALPQIGYVRRLSAEGVLSLAPDLVIAAHDAGPAVVLDQLEGAGVRVERAPDALTAEEIPAKIAFVGRAIGREAEAEAAVARFEDQLSTVREKVARLDDRPRALFVLSVQGGAPLVGGRDTVADAMLRLAGAENVGAGVQGYKPMGREAVLAANPEVIVVMDQHAERIGGIGAILERPEIAQTPAGQANRGVQMDGMFLLGFSVRTPQAVAELARALHPETAAAAGL